MIRQVFVHVCFSEEAAKAHAANLDRGCHMCGWIPAECPIYFNIGIDPVYVSPEHQPPATCVSVLCLVCAVQMGWAEPFALVARQPPIFRANVEIPDESPSWMHVDQFPTV